MIYLIRKNPGLRYQPQAKGVGGQDFDRSINPIGVIDIQVEARLIRTSMRENSRRTSYDVFLNFKEANTWITYSVITKT